MDVASGSHPPDEAARLLRVIDAVPSMWFCLSAEGRFLAAGGDLQPFARTPGQLIGRSVADVVPDEMATRAMEGIARALSAGRAQVELRLELGGSDRLCDAVFVATPAGEVVAFVQDATERLSVERELDETRLRLGAIAEAHDDVFYVGEIGDDGAYHELFCGPGSDRLLGGTPPDGMESGPAWDAAVHPADRDAYVEMNDALLRGEPARAEYRLIGLDGVVRWIYDRARPRREPGGGVVFDGVITDMTARRDQADALFAALHEIRASHAALEEAHAASLVMARTDVLTGLFNRRHFGDALAAELARSAPPRTARRPRAARRRPLQADQRRLRPRRRRRRCWSRSRAGCGARSGPYDAVGALGRRGVRGARAPASRRRRAALAHRREPARRDRGGARRPRRAPAAT